MGGGGGRGKPASKRVELGVGFRCFRAAGPEALDCKAQNQWKYWKPCWSEYSMCCMHA